MSKFSVQRDDIKSLVYSFKYFLFTTYYVVMEFKLLLRCDVDYFVLQGKFMVSIAGVDSNFSQVDEQKESSDRLKFEVRLFLV